ncbi:MAG: FHA domain-containing protein [Deltaproteobacteria bacterium]|nr:FHA domain-containing protein [Deltaproteobacteria bacterium]
MGRAPNIGAPQRVSAHVVPKATATSPFSAQTGTGEEEDKTTIESGWEDDPSTTVEQGEVADRIRALGVEPPRRPPASTSETSTNAGLDELTVDDPNGLAALSLVTPPTLQARLVVTAGNDSGQEVAVVPGKTYTIGRAVENDIVLTDIAVSRKHFDLRHEAGAWVLVDRGSGNGTLVNGNLEDHPFMLANGDAIEIGNTTFRFELPNGPPRSRSSFDVDDPMDDDDDDDDEEMSTVAGKPLRSEELATPSHLPSSSLPIPAPRAKTMPPPAPLRPRSPSSLQSPPLYPPTGAMPGPLSAAMTGAIPGPASSAAMTNPMGGPLPATTLPMPQQQSTRPMAPNTPTMLGDAMGIPLPGSLPPTLPGQGGQPQMFNAYSNGGPQQNMAQMLVVNGAPGRDAPSTTLVPPTPYGGMPVMVPQGYNAPAIPRRTKLILGGAGLALFAAIATVAIIKGAGGGKAPKPPDGNGSATVKTSENTATTPKGDPKLSVSPSKTEPKVTSQPIPPANQPPSKPDNKLATALKGEVPPTKVEPAKVEPAKVEPAKVEPAKVEPAKVEPAKVEPAKVTQKDSSKKDSRKKDPPKVVKKDPPPKDPPDEEPRKKDPPPKRVAMGDSDGARTKAEGLYKNKKFADAGTVLLAASKSAGDPEQAKELRTKAIYYSSFGKNYNTGMAPGTSAKDAWVALTAAKTFDNSLGGEYTSEINARMGAIAPKAAVAFMAGKDYVKAKQAVGIAESSGNGNSTTQGVRSSLEQKAGDLYKEGQALQSSDPAAAKAKYVEVQRMVDSKSPWHQKAGKAISALKG